MASFAERTGIVGGAPQRRYLWTDAFAVQNFLALGQRELADELVGRVHHVLGRHRDDDGRRGWISGLSDVEGEAHPTLGGLRIGKPLPERAEGERIDQRIEWDRDGQYFHYLTKWMQALVAAGHVAWARELAETAYRRFVHGSRMYWKMSIDLSRPQVASMGQHDPLDGYLTALELGLPDLAGDYRRMIDPEGLATDDPLGLGGLLVDAARLTALDRDRALQAAIVRAGALGLARYIRGPDLRMPAERRLAFREIGLAIGLPREDRLRAQLVAFWTDPAHRRTHTYREHEDINDVMLATALAAP